MCVLKTGRRYWKALLLKLIENRGSLKDRFDLSRLQCKGVRADRKGGREEWLVGDGGGGGGGVLSVSGQKRSASR